jgi:predicted Kef-type K+ transport protein
MGLTGRTVVVLGALVALLAITLSGSTLAVTIAWAIAAVALAGAALSMSPSVRLRGRVNRMDSGSGPPVDERSRGQR